MVNGKLRRIRKGALELDDYFWQVLENLPKFRRFGKVRRIVPG